MADFSQGLFGGGINDLLAYIDSRKKVLAQNMGGLLGMGGANQTPTDTANGLLGDLAGRAQGQLDAAKGTQSVFPEIRDQAQQRMMNGLLSSGGPMGLGMTKAAAPLFDFANPGGGSRVANIGNTEITYGVGKNGIVDVILVKTPKQYRGEGSARTAMEAMTNEADQSGLRLALNAEPMDKGVTQSGLERFYKSLGFRYNHGNKIDFDTSANWVRDPIPPE